MKKTLKNSSQLADTCRGSFPQPIHFLRDQLISDASRDADADDSIDEESDVLGCRWLYMATKGLTIAPRWSSCLSVVACCYWSRCNQTWIYMNKYSWTWIISYRLARFSRTLVPTRIVLNKVLSEISLLWSLKVCGINASKPLKGTQKWGHRIFWTDETRSRLSDFSQNLWLRE